jgi:hypothetical protein
MAAINNARKQHSAKKNLSNSNHGQNRYYQTKPGKFDDLKPGVLGPETRECLGIGVRNPLVSFLPRRFQIWLVNFSICILNRQIFYFCVHQVQ